MFVGCKSDAVLGEEPVAGEDSKPGPGVGISEISDEVKLT